MTASKEQNGSWTAQFWYEDIYGKRRHKCKRGFETEEEAMAFEDAYKNKTRGSMDMKLADFIGVYAEDVKPMIREYTWNTREYIINDKIIPVLGKKRMRDITTADIIAWQNGLLSGKRKGGKPYSATYLRTVNSALRAVFNHAERFYGLHPNPMKKAPAIGSKNAREMNIWTKDQYLKFADAIAEETELYVAFELLYWTGIRLGELLALMPQDFDFSSSTMNICHSYRRLKGQDKLTPPKTEKSIRKIILPEFLRDEVRDYVCNVALVGHDERIFEGIGDNQLRDTINGESERLGLPKIRIHDFRHSHVSLLIDMGFSAVAIAERTGHESAEITFRYGHMFPGVQDKMASSIEDFRQGGDGL